MRLGLNYQLSRIEQGNELEATTVQFISLLVEKKPKSDSIKEYLELLDACEQMLTLVEILENSLGIVCGEMERPILGVSNILLLSWLIAS